MPMRLLHHSGMSDPGRAAEIERLLQLLLHDLRSPLGVAQGYVSLLSGQDLSSDDRVRAMRGVSDAIARMSCLVDDVAGLLSSDDTDLGGGLVEAGVLCERVSSEAGRRGVQAPPPESCGPMKVRVGTSVDRLAEAVCLLLTPADRGRRGRTVPLTLDVSQDPQELKFKIADVEDPGELAIFDESGIRSVDVLRAHRHISSLRGRVWSKVGESRAYLVALPLHH